MSQTVCQTMSQTRSTRISKATTAFTCKPSLPEYSNSTEIDARSMADATALTRWFGQETRRVYGLLSGQQTDNRRAELLGLIRARFNGRVTARELAHGCRKCRAPGAAETALQELVSARRADWEAQVAAGGCRVMVCVSMTTGNAVTVTQVPQTAEIETSVTVTAVTAVTTATATETPPHRGHPVTSWNQHTKPPPAPWPAAVGN